MKRQPKIQSLFTHMKLGVIEHSCCISQIIFQSFVTIRGKVKVWLARKFYILRNVDTIHLHLAHFLYQHVQNIIFKWRIWTFTILITMWIEYTRVSVNLSKLDWMTTVAEKSVISVAYQRWLGSIFRLFLTCYVYHQANWNDSLNNCLCDIHKINKVSIILSSKHDIICIYFCMFSFDFSFYKSVLYLYFWQMKTLGLNKYLNHKILG